MASENIKIEIEFEVNGTDVDTDIEKDPKIIKKEKDQKNTNDTVDLFEAGNVGEIQKFSSQQFGNVKQFATNPFQFVFGTVIKKFGKIGKAGLFIGIGLLVFEIVKFAFDELMQPGRIWDRRFKRLIQNEVLIFKSKKEKEELRRGFKEVRVTTRQGLRGGAGKVSGNLFVPFAIPSNFLKQKAITVKDNPRVAGLPGRGKSARFNP